MCWLAVVVGIQCAAFTVAMGLHGGGFDDCDLQATGQHEGLQQGIAGASVLASAVVAAWRLRGRALYVAIGVLLLASFCWTLLLTPTQDCGEISPAAIGEPAAMVAIPRAASRER